MFSFFQKKKKILFFIIYKIRAMEIMFFFNKKIEERTIVDFVRSLLHLSFMKKIIFIVFKNYLVYIFMHVNRRALHKLFQID